MDKLYNKYNNKLKELIDEHEKNKNVIKKLYSFKLSYGKVIDEEDVTTIVDESKKYDEEITNFETKRDQYKKLLNDISKLTEDEEEDETLTEESNKQEFDVPYSSSYGFFKEIKLKQP